MRPQRRRALDRNRSSWTTAGVCFVATWLVAAAANAQELIWDSGSWDTNSWVVPEPSSLISGVVALVTLLIVRGPRSRRSKEDRTR
jgi:hypothetical protein